MDKGGGPQHHISSSSTDLVRSPVLCGSTGPCVSHAPPDITGAVWSSLSGAWSASLTGESWEPGSWTTWSPLPTALGRISEGSRSELTKSRNNKSPRIKVGFKSMA